MSWSSRLVAPLSLALLVLSSGAVAAQTGTASWAVSDDGLAFATNDAFGAVPEWSAVTPDESPAAIRGLPGPDLLYRIEGTLDSGTRAGRIVVVEDTAGFENGRTPVVATAVADDDGGVGWALEQHIVATPFDCVDGDGCIDTAVVAELADLAAPPNTPVDPFPLGSVAPGRIVSTNVLSNDGTLFSLGGDASVGTTVRVRDDGRIVFQGSADIGDSLGGRLRGFDVTVIDPEARVPWAGQPTWDSLQGRARAVRDMGASSSGFDRWVFDCPPGGEGVALSQFLIGGFGRNVGPAIHPGLEGGVPVLVTEVIAFDCGRGLAGDLVIEAFDEPVAGVVCAWAQPRHQPFSSERGGRQVTSNSSFVQRYLVATLGLAPRTPEATLIARVADANDGQLFSVEIEGIQLDSAVGADVWLWVGESQVGIDAYGPKRYGNLDLVVDGHTFDIAEQWRELMGDAFDMGPGQTPVSNCPDVEFTLAGAQRVFADGLGSHDVSAWSTGRPD
ncbi:MAG: hypothetical protein AB1Z67_12500 [Candidatus Limnocylindrales bacterium]